MFNLLRVLSYPSVNKKELNQLPREPGIYYFIDCSKFCMLGSPQAFIIVGKLTTNTNQGF